MTGLEELKMYRLGLAITDLAAAGREWQWTNGTKCTRLHGAVKKSCKGCAVCMRRPAGAIGCGHGSVGEVYELTAGARWCRWNLIKPGRCWGRELTGETRNGDQCWRETRGRGKLARQGEARAGKGPGAGGLARKDGNAARLPPKANWVGTGLAR
ncbi:hypothetical protein CRYUN_Cryun06bG0074800 [Craigia yunnanensis]